MRTEWTSAKRLVVKIGSSLLVDSASGTLKAQWLASLCDDIARLKAQGKEVIVVSSGAIALGRNVLKLPKGALKLEDSQAAAAVGQIALAHAYEDAFRARGLVAAQVLLTLGDTEERRRYLNARNTVTTLLSARRRAGGERERHGGDERDPLWRQRPARRARRLDDERRLPRAALRCRRLLYGAAGLARATRGGSTKSATSRRRSRPWPAMSARSCRAAAW